MTPFDPIRRLSNPNTDTRTDIGRVRRIRGNEMQSKRQGRKLAGRNRRDGKFINRGVLYARRNALQVRSFGIDFGTTRAASYAKLHNSTVV